MSFRSARAVLVSALTLGAVVPVLVLSTACRSSSSCGCGQPSCCTQGSHAAYPAGGMVETSRHIVTDRGRHTVLPPRDRA